MSDENTTIMDIIESSVRPVWDVFGFMRCQADSGNVVVDRDVIITMLSGVLIRSVISNNIDALLAFARDTDELLDSSVGDELSSENYSKFELLGQLSAMAAIELRVTPLASIHPKDLFV